MAATMGMILDIGTCKTKRVSDENFSPYPLIVTPRHSGFDAGRRQNTNAQACLIAAYQSYLMANATEISGSQFITSSTFDNNEHFGFAQYVNYRRVNNIYGEMNVNGVVAFQCTRGLSKKNVGCEIGVDVSKFKKFIDADWSNIYVEIAGVEYPLISRSFQGTQAYGYWTGMEGNSHPADGVRDDNHNTRICFVDPGLIDVIEAAANQKLDFKIKLKP